MPQRSEPQILADLIRLLTRIESEAERLRREGRPHGQLESDCELIEQARAALHRHVVAEGKAYLNRPRAPLNLWTGACFAAGAVAVATAVVLDIPHWMPITGWVLIITGFSLIIDRKHL